MCGAGDGYKLVFDVIVRALHPAVPAHHLVVARGVGEHRATASARIIVAVLLARLQNGWHGGSAQCVARIYLELVLGEWRDEAVCGAEELRGGVGELVVLAEGVCIHER